jgi:structural maintenance of chromosome 2
MYLKQVIIDGFKSYATRTVVSGFDPSFNAITGLNGSGKSNVLDSICFVLGISNLTQVRASSLQELVYKGGQAGVTKATVTLVFNNSAKETSPVGYEAFTEITVTRQIVIGGRNKYLINGHVAPPARVHNLFHLVGLNVNNPHFLIMQGRITRVIGMKPPEMLSMVEEAAGTKMYENKKEAALKTIEKKARKVEEIDSLLTEKINPSLAKLEKERKHYMEWNQNNNDLEGYTRYTTAYKYHCASLVLEQSEGEYSGTADALQELDDSLEMMAQEKKMLEARLKELSRARSELTGTSDLDALETSAEELDKKLTQTTGLLKNQRAALAAEQASLEALQKSVDEANRTREFKRTELEASERALVQADEAERAVAAAVDDAETALLTGTSSQTSSAAASGSVMDQLEAAKRIVSTSMADLDSFKLRAAHLKSQHKEKSSKLASDRAGVRVLEAEKKKMETAIANAKLAVHELDFDEAAARALSSKLTEEKCAAATLRERFDQLSARLSAYDFQYTNPKPNFDRRKVHGTVAKLVRAIDPAKATALEVAAGGRLYQVVVDNDDTAKDLLKNGKLARRVTILPLNKIRHTVLDQKRQHRAKQLDPDCELALHLVGYDSDVAHAMEHVFGQTLICDDMDSAKRVTFDNGVRARTVTLDGDVYDPSGTLSGGSSNRGGGISVLVMLGELVDAQAELSTRSKTIERLAAQLRELDAKSKKHRQLTAALDIQQHQAELLNERLSTSVTGRLLGEVEALALELSVTIPEGVKIAKQALQESDARIVQLEDELADSNSARQRVLAEAEAAAKAVKEAHITALSQFQKCKDVRNSLRVEIEALVEEAERLEQQRSDILEPGIAKLAADVEAYEAKVVKETERFDMLKQRLEEEKSRVLESDSDIASVRTSLDDLGESADNATLERNKLRIKLRETERGRVAAERLVERLDAECGWIALDNDTFGVTGSEYEFTEPKLNAANAALEKLKDRQDALSKKINKKAMHMFETAKDEYTSLVQKKRIIEQDKAKIEDVIAGLDEKKMVALRRTWKEVNRSFGEIFSELLPGTSAKLEPPPGKSVEDGLEIRVAFGAVWKDSLSELSGGQRSLIALSLVLAMLRFKPAPMYILDEVDAALDLSHTQNIGRMLRKHFSGSQFIVVSLKEGMFNNANVIFRTRFVDGVSTISKSVNDTSHLDRADAVGASKGKAATKSTTNSVSDKENAVLDDESTATAAPGGGRKRRAQVR